MSKDDMQKAKEMVEGYYKNLRVIQHQQLRLHNLMTRAESINEDRNNPKLDFSLNTDIGAITYDGIVVTGGKIPRSKVENDLERIYARLDKEYEDTQKEILNTKYLIRSLERQNEKIELYLNLLHEEAKNLLEMKYTKRKGITQISLEMNMSKSTVCKYFNQIFLDIAKLIREYGV